MPQTAEILDPIFLNVEYQTNHYLQDAKEISKSFIQNKEHRH